MMKHFSFKKMWENMDASPKIDSLAMKAIRNGISINENFWDDFMSVCNNPEALGDLLDVSTDQIRVWGAKIKNALEEVKKADNNKHDKEKTTVLDTGEGDAKI